MKQFTESAPLHSDVLSNSLQFSLGLHVGFYKMGVLLISEGCLEELMSVFMPPYGSSIRSGLPPSFGQTRRQILGSAANGDDKESC